MTKPLVELLSTHKAPILVSLAVLTSVMSGCAAYVDSLGFGTAYVDANCNGVKDPGEKPLAGVCVWTSGHAFAPTPSREECDSEEAQTDSEGESAVAWYSGASCDEVFVFAQAPDGLQPTTDTVVNGCEGDFGFAPEGTCPPHASVTPGRLVAYKRLRDAACWFGAPAVLVLLGLIGYRKLRPHAVARHQTHSGE